MAPSAKKMMYGKEVQGTIRSTVVIRAERRRDQAMESR
jgi:hypothetical protein